MSTVIDRTVTIATSAGPLLGTWHLPEGDPIGVAVVAPGVAVPARVLAPLADRLADRGWRALRFDFHGVGSSPVHPRDVPGGMAEWGSRDLDAALRLAREVAGEGPDRLPVALVGHSAGAWLLAFTPQAADVDGVLAIASMAGYWRNLKRSSWPQMLPAFHGAIPLLTRAFGYLPGWAGLGEDAPGEALRQWASWCRRPGFFADDPTVTSQLHRLTAPVRVLLPEDDEWATGRAVDALWAGAGSDHEVVEVPASASPSGRVGHLGLLREPVAGHLWDEHLRWLEAATGT